MKDIQNEISILAIKAGLLITDILPTITEISDGCPSICSEILRNTDNENQSSNGHLFVCAGMASFFPDNEHIVLNAISNLCDTSSVEEYLLDFCDIDSGTEQGEDFINHTDALYSAAIGLMMEEVQKDSPDNETIADKDLLHITTKACMLMFRLGLAIQKEAQQNKKGCYQ